MSKDRFTSVLDHPFEVRAWIKVVPKHQPPVFNRERLEWCDDCLNGRWSMDSKYFYFEEEQDATRFALKWS